MRKMTALSTASPNEANSRVAGYGKEIFNTQQPTALDLSGFLLNNRKLHLSPTFSSNIALQRSHYLHREIRSISCLCPPSRESVRVPPSKTLQSDGYAHCQSSGRRQYKRWMKSIHPVKITALLTDSVVLGHTM